MKKIILSILFIVFIICICGCQTDSNIEASVVITTEPEDALEATTANVSESSEPTEPCQDVTTEATYEPSTDIPMEPIVETPMIYCSTDEYSATIIAKTIYGEARGISSATEQACVAWTILNRVDCYGGTVESIVTTPHQFAYSYYFPTVDDNGRDLLSLAKDVLGRWEAEKNGETEVGRVLPHDYLWYAGDGYHNYFRNTYEGGQRWDYSLESPYES